VATSKRRVTHSSTLWARPNPTPFQNSSQGEKRKGAQNHLLRSVFVFLIPEQETTSQPQRDQNPSHSEAKSERGG
jgi:hypothetical protein